MKYFTACIAATLLVTTMSLPLQDTEDIDDIDDFDDIEIKAVTDMRFPVGIPESRGAVLDRKWPNGIVPYVIGSYSPAERAIIQNLLNEIMQRTCVRFVPRTNQRTYLEIFNGDGCWSFVGYISGFTNQRLSLKSPGCVSREITFHEVLHALGFVHEQNREDRDYFLAVHLDNARPDEDTLMKSSDTSSVGIPYSVESAMHYSPMDFSVNGKKVMMSTRPHHPVGNTGIPWSDWRRVNRLYNCPPSYEAAIDKLEF